MISQQIYAHDTTASCDHFIKNWIKTNNNAIGSDVSNLPGAQVMRSPCARLPGSRRQLHDPSLVAGMVA